MLKLECNYTMLNVQYRMHPDIAHYMNELFYDDRTMNDPSILGRPDVHLFARWAQKEFKIARNLVFVHVGDDEPLYRKHRGASSVNPKSATMVVYLLDTMTKEGIPKDKSGF